VTEPRVMRVPGNAIRCAIRRFDAGMQSVHGVPPFACWALTIERIQ
jgi:hypothetical protein